MVALLPEIMFSDHKLKTQNVHPAEIPFQKTMPFFLKCHRQKFGVKILHWPSPLKRFYFAAVTFANSTFSKPYVVYWNPVFDGELLFELGVRDE